MPSKLRMFAGHAGWVLSAWMMALPTRAAATSGLEKFTPAMLDALIQEYREAGLPLPPPDAPLLLLPMNSRRTDDGKTVDIYILGFRLAPGRSKTTQASSWSGRTYGTQAATGRWTALHSSWTRKNC